MKTDQPPRYKRVIIKISGEALADDGTQRFDQSAFERVATCVQSLHARAVQTCLVVGGGNIFRGRLSDQFQIEAAEADQVGMMATVLNGLMIRAFLQAHSDLEVRVMTAIPINAIAEPFIRLRAIRHLERSCVVVLVAGTGNPFVTTDYAAVQRAVELRADALLAAKFGIDGLYTADPRVEPDAKRYSTATYETVIQKNLKALDQSATILARDHNLPIHVFDGRDDGAVDRICNGENVGSLIGADDDAFAPSAAEYCGNLNKINENDAIREYPLPSDIEPCVELVARSATEFYLVSAHPHAMT